MSKLGKLRFVATYKIGTGQRLRHSLCRFEAYRPYQILKKRMQGIGKDKWLHYHFNSNTTRVNDKDNFTVEFSAGTADILDFETACKRVAEEIVDTTEQPLYVAMSGGCDSETVANSFYKLGVPFTPIIHETYYLGLEAYYADTWWAKRWCKDRGIVPEIKRSTFPEMFADNKPIADKIKARKLYPVQNAVLADYVKSQGGVLVNGQAFIEYYPEPTLDYLKNIVHDPAFDNYSSGWLLHEDDFYVDMNDPGYHPYNFLSWNREIVLAYINSRDMQLSSEENKFKIMNCSPRPKLGVPEVAWVFLKEYQDKLKRRYGTSEVCFLGTHEEMINKLCQTH